MMKLYLIIALTLVLAACSSLETNSTSNQPKDTDTLGLLKVTVTDMGLGNNADVKTEWVQTGAESGLSPQAPVVVNPGIGPNLGQLEFKSRAFNFFDTLFFPFTRYLSITLDISNHTTINFPNLILYAASTPSNLGGTAITSMTAANGSAITNTTLARRFMPTHGMTNTLQVSASTADLFLATPSESQQVKNAAVNLGVLTARDDVLEYGFVARNLSGGRHIDRGVASTGCTKIGCQGTVTLAYRFPRSSPTSANPTSFSFLFVVARESVQIGSQSSEEQGANTVMGQSNPDTNFKQLRTLQGSNFGISDDRLNNLCRVKTAISPDVFLTPPFPTAPGSLDKCFGAGGKKTTAIGTSTDQAHALAIQSDGKIVVAGHGNFPEWNFTLARYNHNGSLDTSFGTGGKVRTLVGSRSWANALAIQSDGKIVVAGFSSNGSNYDFALVRYNPNGSLDTSFGTGGKVTTDFNSSNDIAASLAIQSDGKIVLAGHSGGSPSHFALARYNPNGSLDTSFDGDGKLTTAFSVVESSLASALAIQSDGKIIAAGYYANVGNRNFALVRYNPNGSLDTSFDSDGKVTTDFNSSSDIAASLAIQNDGRIVVAGTSASSLNADFALARYNLNGSLDTSFGTGGKVTTDFNSGNDTAYDLAIQSNGRIVVAGQIKIGSGSDWNFALVRYNLNGSLDTGFGTNGKVTTDFGPDYSTAEALAIQSNGKIVLGGHSNRDFALARYNP
jgi:uncharacterized delta-60 repeat protein